MTHSKKFFLIFVVVAGLFFSAHAHSDTVLSKNNFSTLAACESAALLKNAKGDFCSCKWADGLNVAVLDCEPGKKEVATTTLDEPPAVYEEKSKWPWWGTALIVGGVLATVMGLQLACNYDCDLCIF